MAFVYEVNGQRVEFETEPTEADIDEAARSLGPAPESAPPPEEASAVTIPGAVIPGETGLGNLGRQALDVGVDTGKAAINASIAPVVEAYSKNPLKAGMIDAVTTMATGAPLGSAYQSIKNLPQRYEVAKQGVAAANAALSKTPPSEFNQALAAGKFPDAPDAFRNLRATATKLDPAFSQQMSDALKAGNDPAVKKLLDKAPDALKKDPKFAAQMQKYLDVIPGVGTKVRRVVEPFVRGASKVLAPAAAAFEGTQAYQQARQGDYTGATMSALNAASMFNPAGILAQPGLAIMQSANKNFRSQTPAQQRESVDAALSGTAPGMYGDMAMPYSTNDDYEDAKASKQITMAVRMKAAKKVLGQR
jgi:hypothetical protein